MRHQVLPKNLGRFGTVMDSSASECRGNLEVPAMDTIEAQLIQLRPRLYAYARGKGLTPDDAEDLVSDAWIKTAQWEPGKPKSEGELTAYGFRALKSVMTDFWASPARVLSKRLERVIASPKGSDPVVSCQMEGIEHLCLQNQIEAGRQVSSSVEELEGRLSDFLYGSTGLAGDSPSSMTTRLLVTRLLRWWGKPVSKPDLLRVLTALVPSQTRVEPLDDDLPTAAFEEPSGLGQSLMSAIETMPFRMRAALLLNLEIDEYQSLVRGNETELSAVLEEWVPPPALELSLLPVDDELVATKLSVTKSYLHVIRNRAREMMRTHAYKLGIFEGGGQ